MAGKRRKKEHSFSNFLGILSIAAVVMILLVVLSRQTSILKTKDASYAAQQEELQEEYDRLTEKSQELQEESVRVQTRQYIEDMARSRLGLVYPGEVILKPTE